MLTMEKINKLRQSTKPKDKIIVSLWDKGGIAPLKEISEKVRMSEKLVMHHIRESYHLSKRKNDIIKLEIKGTDDTRYWSNPWQAPDMTAFVFSLLVQDFELNYKNAFPSILQYAKEHNCLDNRILENCNLFYTVKKQVKHYLDSR